MAFGQQLAIHGMLHSHNFGDVLLAAAFRKWVLEVSPETEVVFPWARKECVDDILSHAPNASPQSSSLSARTPILFCGGQYVNDGNTVQGAYKRFRRIQAKGLLGRLRGARYAVLGIGIGPLGTAAGKWLNTAFLRGADIVAVREQDSYDLAGELSVPKRKLALVSDAAIAYVREQEGLPKNAPAADDRVLLLHISVANEGLVGGIKRYLKNQKKTYSRILLTSDKLGKSPISDVHTSLMEDGIEAITCMYENHHALMNLINRADDVLTTKYHVGIVAGALGKRVCAIPWNYYKVQRFYDEVGSPEHCKPLAKAATDDVAVLLRQVFLNSPPIKTPVGMVERSSSNRMIVREWLSVGR